MQMKIYLDNYRPSRFDELGQKYYEVKDGIIIWNDN